MEQTQTKPAEGGIHPVEWGCEFVGTAMLLIGGLSAVCLDFGPGTPLHAVPHSPRLLLTGLLFAGTGSLIAITPFGRRSGAHINPVVTLTFWTQRKVHPHDLIGYVLAQLAGAIAGAAIVRVLWQHKAVALNVGATLPGRHLTDIEAALVEALMTATLILTILFMTSSTRTARWTPLVLWLLIAVLVWRGAPYTGTSMNPARSLGPAVVAPVWAHFAVYVVGPLLGGAVAVALFAGFREQHVLTAKLFHDPAYPSTLGTSLPTPSTPRARTAS